MCYKMTKKNIDYSKTMIYKIVCKDLNVTDLYVGHTTNFIQRKKRHKSSCINEASKHHYLKVYRHIRKNGNWKNWSMILIENFPCNNSLEARSREREWCEKINANLNMVCPMRSIQELKTYKYEWELAQKCINPEKHKLSTHNKNKTYYDKNAETIKIKKKEYYDKNSETIKIKKKEYYDKNVEAILEKSKEKFTCSCGGKYCYSNRSTHMKTKKHQKYLEELTEE